jgi:hypothetical protein
MVCRVSLDAANRGDDSIDDRSSTSQDVHAVAEAHVGVHAANEEETH